MSVYSKINQARIRLQNTKLKKSGHNKFAGYDYFELGDFLPEVQKIFENIGLCGVISFAKELATLTITDVEDNSQIVITSPMADANLKGCHPIQNLGAVETYTRRYLWVTALEIVEHDALDATTGSGKITPSSGVWESMETDQQTFLQDIANQVIDLINKGDVKGALEHINDQNLDTDEKVALNTRFDSKQRSAMKKVHEEMKGNK